MAIIYFWSLIFHLLIFCNNCYFLIFCRKISQKKHSKFLAVETLQYNKTTCVEFISIGPFTPCDRLHTVVNWRRAFRNTVLNLLKMPNLKMQSNLKKKTFFVKKRKKKMIKKIKLIFYRLRKLKEIKFIFVVISKQKSPLVFIHRCTRRENSSG